ncbi:MAG: phenylalanine--tRNA ligase subunit beta [Nitriliruptorales bacterium]|nr:phenylalanine--tRNA ligase subunit beta [Nitriliruptorales bacterium]
MKVPVSWLRSFVDLDGMPVDEIIDVMSLNGLEVEEILRPGHGTAGVRVKRVIEREPHPDADKLQVVQVTDGDTETELVCGAWNFEVGDLVAHAEVGATIPPQQAGGEPFELAARKIRGVTSNGMLCSARELQLGEDHEGIIVLPDDAPLGADLTDVLPVGEPVIDVAVLSDRGDHHSILGIARELAAILDTSLSVPEVPVPDTDGAVDLTIHASDGCSHFATWAVEGARIGPSPWWVRQRLAQCGIRAINTVVDVTNYVMLELGQPLHAFDLDQLEGPELHIRWAEDGETLVTLDDQTRELAPTDLVIADASRIVSLAGVMGGAETEVSAATDRVLIEGAIWDPSTIRRTSRRLNLVSEASLRFERGVDPAGARRAVARAVELLEDVAGATRGKFDEAGGEGADRGSVTVDPGRVSRLLGVEVPADTQRGYLERLGCAVADDDGSLVVTPPSWRGDLVRPADVAEEVARLHGYERIPATLPDTRVVGGLTRQQRAEREIRAAALSSGFHEVTTRPFSGDRVLEGVTPSDGRVSLVNPVAKDTPYMSPTLVEGLLGVVRRNVGQGRPGVAVFEYARIFRPAGDPIEESLKAFGEGWRWHDHDERQLPTQPRTLGLAAQGAKAGQGWLDADEVWSPYDLLAVFDEVAERLAPPDDPTWQLERAAVEREGYHPGRSAVLRLRGTDVGFVGALHPVEADRRDLPEPVIVGELLVEPLLEHLVDDVAPVQARPLVTHPALTIDVALAAPEDVTYEDLAAAARAGAGDLLDELWFFDEYRGEQVGPGQRSVAMRLRLQAPDRQLTDDDADAVIAAVGREAEVIGATLRR